MKQYVIDCPDPGCPNFGHCNVIVGEFNGSIVWVSHMTKDVDVEPRLNIDYPECEDYRG